MDQSTGSAAVAMAEFDLAKELAHAEQQKPWAQGRYSRTLVKEPDMRVLLVSMEKGAELKEHHVDGPISVHVLKGSIRFAAGQDSRTVMAGTLIILPASIKHEVEAPEDAAFLVTISWPEASRLQALPHRGYGR